MACDITGAKIDKNPSLPTITIVKKSSVRINQITDGKDTEKMPSSDEKSPENKAPVKPPVPLTSEDLAKAMEEPMQRALNPI